MSRGPGTSSMFDLFVTLKAPSFKYSPTSTAPSSPAAKAKPPELAARWSILVKRDSRNLSNPPAVPSQTLPSRSSRLADDESDVGPVQPSVGQKSSAENPIANPWRN